MNFPFWVSTLITKKTRETTLVVKSLKRASLAEEVICVWAHAAAAPRHLYNSSTLHTVCNTQSAAAAVCRTHPAARGRYQPSSVTAQRPLGTVIGGGALRLPSVISALRLSGTWREENEKEKKKKRRQLSGSLVTLASQLLSKVFPLQSCGSTSRMTQHNMIIKTNIT